MNQTNKAKWRRIPLMSILGVLALSASLSAFAQWKWIDAKGVVQYSDLPPPASVSQDKILKRPAGAPAAVPTSTILSDQNVQKKEELKEQEELDKRVKEQEAAEKEEADRKKKEEEKQKKEACKNAKKALDTFETGQRIRQKNKNGEYEYLDDKGIQQKRKQTKDFIKENCR